MTMPSVLFGNNTPSETTFETWWNLKLGGNNSRTSFEGCGAFNGRMIALLDKFCLREHKSNASDSYLNRKAAKRLYWACHSSGVSIPGLKNWVRSSVAAHKKKSGYSSRRILKTSETPAVNTKLPETEPCGAPVELKMFCAGVIPSKPIQLILVGLPIF